MRIEHLLPNANEGTHRIKIVAENDYEGPFLTQLHMKLTELTSTDKYILIARSAKGPTNAYIEFEVAEELQR